MVFSGTTIAKSLQPFQRQLSSGFSAIALYVVGAGLTFSMELALARILGVEQFGLFIAVYSLVSVLTVLSRLGFDTALLRYLPAYDVNNRPELIVGIIRRSGLWVLYSGTLIGLITAVSFLLTEGHGEATFIYTVFLGCALLILLGQTGVKQASLLGLGFTTLGLLPEKVLFPGFVIIGILAFAQMGSIAPNSVAAMLMAALSAMLALSIASMTLRNRLAERRISSGFPRYRNREWIVSALPYSLLNVAQLSLAKTDIIILGLLCSPSESGKYAAASLLASLVVFFINAGNRVVSVEFSRLFIGNEFQKLQRLFSVSCGAFLLLSVPVLVVLIVFGRVILSFYGQAFIEAFDAMLILVLGQSIIVLGGSVGYLLAMTEYQALASKVVVMASVLNLMLNLLLIPYLGMTGAAVATCIALIFRGGVLGYLVWKKLGIMPTAVGPWLLKLIHNHDR